VDLVGFIGLYLGAGGSDLRKEALAGAFFLGGAIRRLYELAGCPLGYEVWCGLAGKAPEPLINNA
jgi:hypothetical protein